jgi:hypothetical protein
MILGDDWLRQTDVNLQVSGTGRGKIQERADYRGRVAPSGPRKACETSVGLAPEAITNQIVFFASC